MTYSFTVTYIFHIEGRGIVLLPGLPTGPNFPNVKTGHSILLRTPGGRERATIIRSLENIRQSRSKSIEIPILLPSDISKDDVPVGTEVYLLPERPPADP